MANASIFLKLGDKIKGSSTISGYEDYIEVLSWSWGASNHTAMGSGSRTSRGSTDVQGISLSKNLDGASNGLAEFCMTGDLVGDGELHVCRKTADGKVEPYLKMEFKNTFLRSYQVGGAGGDQDSVQETCELGFSKVQGTFTPQDEKGAKQGDKKFGYDLTTGQKV